MSLLKLPEEVLSLIISFYLHGHRQSRDYGYRSLHARLGAKQRDVVTLSSTCWSLRKLCAVHTVRFLSLVRRSELDAILAYPRRMDRWSEAATYREEYFHHLLSDDVSEAIRLNHLVTSAGISEIEIANESLVNGDLHYFPGLAHLSVLAPPIAPNLEITMPPDMVLSRLSMNLETLLSSDQLLRVAAKCARLDLLCDFGFCNPETSFKSLTQAIGGEAPRELNLFVSDPDVLRYSSFVSFLCAALKGNTIAQIALRLYKKASVSITPPAWDLLPQPEQGAKLLFDSLSRNCSLRGVVLDFEILDRLHCSPNFSLPQRPQRSSHGGDVTFTFVDYSLNVPKLLFRPQEIVANLVQALGATRIVFVYGEVIDSAHLHAIGLMSNLLLYLASNTHGHEPYLDVRTVALEKAWSTPDDTLMRRHFETLLDSYDRCQKGTPQCAALEKKIVNACSTERHLFTSPRYRSREAYSVSQVGEDENCVPTMLLTQDVAGDRDRFWDVQVSLQDLEHYSARERVLSRLWD